jgi:hypothetical protein
MSLETDLEGMTAAVKSLVTELKGLGTVMSAMPKNPMGGYGNGTGQMNLGSSFRNSMANSLGSMTSTQIINSGMRWNMGMSIAQGATQAIGGVLAGGAMALPNVAATTGMAKNFYSASIMSGTNYRSLGNYMTGAMRGAMTDPLGASRVAGNLSSMGFARVGSMAGGFENAVTATANLSKYLGMDNDTASMAIGGLSSRSFSKSMMQNYGLFTSNPLTGKKNTAGQNISQLGDMFLSTAGGAKLKKEDVLTSLQSGFLGANLEGSGLDATQQSLVAQYMVAKVSGKKFDLDKAGGLSQVAGAAGGAGGKNPYSADMQISSAQATTMNAATDAYIKGNNDAAKAVTALQGAITGFLQSPAGQFLARGNAAISTGMTDNAVQGGITGLGGILGGATQIGGTALMTRALFGKTGLGGPRGASGGLGSVLKGGLKGGLIGATAGIAGNLVGGAIKGDSAQGSMQSRFGNAISMGASGAGLGAMVGSIIPGLGTGIGAAIGGIGGALIGGIMGGTESTVSAGTTTDTTGQLKLVRPVPGRISAKYGSVGGPHTVPHLAVDFAVGIGTTVIAAADGVVKSSGGNSKNTYGTSDRSYGLYVIIDHGGGYETVYAHLSQINVGGGQAVKQGQAIGLSGNTGYSTGPHLHFELRKNGNKIDPSPYMGGAYAVTIGANNSGTSTTSGMYSGSESAAGSELIGGINTGGKISIPQSYSGASIGKAAVSATGATRSVGHGASTIGLASSIGDGAGGGPDGTSGIKSSGVNAQVTINLQIANASSAEAEKFAIMVKDYLENENLTTSMGRM